MVSRPKLKLVEFYHHRGDGADIERVDTETDDDADVSDALGGRDESGVTNDSAGTDENSSGSWLRRLAGLALLGGVAFALAQRREEAKAAVDRVREDDRVSRLREDDGTERLAGRDPVSRLRDRDDAETGIDATTEPRVDTDPDDAVTTGVDVSAVDPENGQEDVGAGDVGEAEGVGSGVDVDAVESENETDDGIGGEVREDASDDSTAGTSVDTEGDAETDVGLAPKADAETDVEGESDVGHDDAGTDNGTDEANETGETVDEDDEVGAAAGGTDEDIGTEPIDGEDGDASSTNDETEE